MIKQTLFLLLVITLSINVVTLTNNKQASQQTSDELWQHFDGLGVPEEEKSLPGTMNGNKSCDINELDYKKLHLKRMTISKKEQQTITFYNENSKTWVEQHGPGTTSFWANELQLFQEDLSQGSSILEIGFGGAGEAAEFIKKGYNYTGIDPSSTFVEIAQKQFPNALFLKNSLYDFDLPAQSFDGFWCSAVLLHIPQEKCAQALQRIHHVLKPGALGFISLTAGQGEYFDEKSGRYFYFYEELEFKKILESNGFEIVRHATKFHDTPRIWLRSWLTFFVKAKSNTF